MSFTPDQIRDLALKSFSLRRVPFSIKLEDGSVLEIELIQPTIKEVIKITADQMEGDTGDADSSNYIAKLLEFLVTNARHVGTDDPVFRPEDKDLIMNSGGGAWLQDLIAAFNDLLDLNVEEVEKN